MLKIKASFAFIVITALLGAGCAGRDIVIYGADKTDNYPKQLKAWTIIPCPDSQDCQRLTDPLNNCQVSGAKISCENHHVYTCDSNASWHIVERGYHSEYFCTNGSVASPPSTPIPDSNF